MNFSAHVTRPFPPTRSNDPIIMVDFHSNLDGLGSPAARRHKYKKIPGIRNRVEAIKNGGIVSIAKRIAR
jgi:hypothetical protein